jgi:hypothetical protein
MASQNTGEDSSILQFDLFPTPAQCVIALIASIAVLQKSVAKLNGATPDPITWVRFLDEANEAPTFKSQGVIRTLDEFFVIDGDEVPRSLDGRNKGTVERVGNLVIKIVRDCQKTGSLTVDASIGEEGNRVRSLVDRLLAFCDARGEQDKHILQKQVEKVSARPSDEAVEKFIEEIYGEPHLPHPQFSSIEALSLVSLKAELLDLCKRGGGSGIHGGLFAVVREARSWYEKDDMLGNLIVRDILWLLPQDVGDDEPAREAGVYISATDRAAFMVDRIVPEENMLHLVGHLEKNGHVAQRLKLIVTKFDVGHQLEHRFGVLTGVTPSPDGQDLGAWKVVAVRPEWDTRILDCIAAQLFRDDIEACAKLFADAMYCGVIYSNRLKGTGSGIRDRRTAFRMLLADDPASQTQLSTSLGGYLRSRFDIALKPIVAGIARGPRPDENHETYIASQVDNLLDGIGKVLLHNWVFVNPAQFFIFKRDPITYSVSEVPITAARHLRLLLSTDQVYESVAI